MFTIAKKKNFFGQGLGYNHGTTIDHEIVQKSEFKLIG